MKDIIMQRDLPRLIGNIVLDRHHKYPKHYVFVVDCMQRARQYCTTLHSVLHYHNISIQPPSQSQYVTTTKYGDTFRFVVPNIHHDHIKGLSITEAFVDLTTEHKEEYKEFLQHIALGEAYYEYQNIKPNTIYDRCMRPFWWFRQTWKNTMEGLSRS